MQYFDEQWFQSLPGWYEGFALLVPSTNNSLEATNNVIKNEATIRERLPLKRFLHILRTSIIGKWSKERNPEKRFPISFKTEPVPNGKMWRKGFKLSISKVETFFYKSDNLHYINNSYQTTTSFRKDVQVYRTKKQIYHGPISKNLKNLAYN